MDPDAVWTRLINHLAHRGPDEGAFWRDERFFLGHRRLSIIDLSTGAQPMGTADGSLVITFNGEIYNYVELRDELLRLGHAFSTRSDTEVLLQGYREWGTDLPRRLVGMFSFAIADRRRGELFLARDPFGEKPLLYFEKPGAVNFASELKPLAGIPDLERRLSEASLGPYLCLNYVPGNQTLMEGVCRLPPGSWRLYSARGVKDGRYWTLPSPIERRGLERDEALGELASHLDRAVRLSLVSDVPVGIFLSGGIDSSLIAESAVRQGRLAHAYCLDFPEEGYSEYPKARYVAERLGLPLTRVPFTQEAVRDFLQIVEHADDPLADSSALAVWTVSREAARHNKVVVGGDGGDELFGGYLTYKATLLHAATLSGLPGPFRRMIARAASVIPTTESKVSRSYRLMRFLRASGLTSGQAHFTWNGTWLPEQAARLLRGHAARTAAAGALEEMAVRHGIDGRVSLSSLQRTDLGDYLPNDILPKVDRMSMAHGLEVRAPFLQPPLAEFALSLPSAFRCTLRGKPKRILRERARRLYGPFIADSPKQGFSIPIHTWLRGPARDLVHDLLSPAALAVIGSLNASEVGSVIAAHMSGRRSYGWELWGLMVLSAWHRTRILAPPRPDAGTTDLVERHIPLKGDLARASVP